MLTVSGLRKCLPGGRELFHHLDLRLAAGECVAIMGESGAGKSTLLNIIAGLDSFDGGSIALDGRRLEGLSDRQLTELRRQHFGFVFQAFHILPHLSLLQNVELTLLLNQVPRAAARGRASAVLAEVGLGLRIDDFPRQLSGGELQRVAIARALVHRPAVLLADEPTGNLDPDNAARVLALMSDLMRKDGTATLLVTHSEATAAIADRRLRLTAQGLEPF
jgi:putative ABC transport system ATP-binding protein